MKQKLSEKATVPWVRKNIRDKEVSDFFVLVLSAKVVKE